MIALIPARAGSKRIPGKNTKLLGRRPLIGHTIDAALMSGVFERVVVCTDDYAVTTYCFEHWGVPVISRDLSADTEADIVWVRSYFQHQPRVDAFAILRPTSPFRSAETIRRAWAQWQRESD